MRNSATGARTTSLRQSTWALPILIALAALAGLTLGLVGDGVFDVLIWIGLLPALLAIAWAWRSRGRA